MSFITTLREAQKKNQSLVCVGFDPELSKFPVHLKNHPDALFEFHKAIVDATADLVCCYKPQIAHFAALSAEDSLQRTIAYIHETYPGIPVILDAKRGDIGSTAERYAIEAFDRYQADAVTLNPYLGRDSIQPFLDRKDKGVILLCRTSNKGAGDFQDLISDGKPLYQHVARTVAEQWNEHGNCMLVVRRDLATTTRRRTKSCWRYAFPCTRCWCTGRRCRSHGEEWQDRKWRWPGDQFIACHFVCRLRRGFCRSRA